MKKFFKEVVCTWWFAIILFLTFMSLKYVYDDWNTIETYPIQTVKTEVV